MSSIYKNLSEDLKFENQVAPPPLRPAEPKTPRLFGIKIAIAGAFVVSLAALVGAGILYQDLNRERRQREAVEAVQNQLREKSSSLEQAGEQFRIESGRMRDQLKTYASERNELKKKLEETGSQVVQLQNKLKLIEDKNQAVEKEAETQFKPMGTPEQGDNESDGAASSQSSTPQSPQVLTVNRKFNFVVVGLGFHDGVKMGDTLKAERAGKEIGTIQVEKLYENFSAATIIKEGKDVPIKEGDLVRKSS